MIIFIFVLFISCEFSLELKDKEYTQTEDVDCSKNFKEDESFFIEDNVENPVDDKNNLIEELRIDDNFEITFDKIIYEKPVVEKNFSIKKIEFDEKKFEGYLKGKISYIFTEHDPLVEYLSYCFKNNSSLNYIEYFLQYYSIGSLDKVYQESLKYDNALLVFKEYQVKKNFKILNKNEVKTLEILNKTKNIPWKQDFLVNNGIYFVSEKFFLKPDKSYIFIVDNKKTLYEVDCGKTIKEVLSMIDSKTIYNNEEIVFFNGYESFEKSFWISFDSLNTFIEKSKVYTIFLNKKEEKKEDILEVKKDNIKILEDNHIYEFFNKKTLIIVEQMNKKPFFIEEDVHLNGYKFSINMQNKNKSYIGQQVNLLTKLKKMSDYNKVDDIFPIISSGTILSEGKSTFIFCDKHCFIQFDKKEFGIEPTGTITPRFSTCKGITKIYYPKSIYERFQLEDRLFTKIYNFGQNCQLQAGQCEDNTTLSKECALGLLREHPVKYQENMYYYEQNYKITAYSLN